MTISTQDQVSGDWDFAEDQRRTTLVHHCQDDNWLAYYEPNDNVYFCSKCNEDAPSSICGAAKLLNAEKLPASKLIVHMIGEEKTETRVRMKSKNKTTTTYESGFEGMAQKA